MKKLITTLTAVTFALGLAAAGYAQTVKTPEKPAVKTEAPAAATPAAPKDVKPGEPAVKEVKPGEKAQPTAKEAGKPGEAEKTKKEVKEAKKVAKKGKEEKKPVTPEKPKEDKK